MNADLKKMIEICKNPKIQELIRKVWPKGWRGYVLHKDSRFLYYSFLYTYEGKDEPPWVFIPFILDEERACSQIDTLLMEVIREQNTDYKGEITLDLLSSEYNMWLDLCHETGYLPENKSDLYLKLLWLEELLEAQNDTEV